MLAYFITPFCYTPYKRRWFYENVYACLLGEWVNLSESNDVVIDNAYTDVNLWYKEQIDNLFNFNYINIKIDNVNYRIHPSFVQVLTK